MPASLARSGSCCPALQQHLSRPRTRRALLRAAGVALLSLPPLPSMASGGYAGALLLSCMDYRLLDEIVRYMDSRKLTDNYDHVILAGASLGATTDTYPFWGSTFWSHLELAVAFHRVSSLIVLDHRDCGAYKALLGQDYAQDPEREREVHAEQMRKLRVTVAERHPSLPTELLLMALDGSVETIS